MLITGTLRNGKIIHEIAVKVANAELSNEYLEHEKNIYELINEHEHESIPKYFKYFPATDDLESILITELLGKNLYDILLTYNLDYFSAVTSMRIGLKVVRRFAIILHLF